MSTSFYNRLEDVTIPNGSNVSGWVTQQVLAGAAAVVILAPAALDAAHTYIIEVNDKGDGTGIARILEDESGTNVGVPAQGKARWYAELGSFGAFRIKDSTGNVAADRTFHVGVNWTV